MFVWHALSDHCSSFVAYISPLTKNTEKLNVLHNQYADDAGDTALCRFVEKDVHRCNRQPAKLSCCCSNVVQSEWASHNPKKSEAVLLSTAQQAKAAALPLNDVNVAGCVVQFADAVEILGVTIDQLFKLDQLVLNVCKSTYYHIMHQSTSVRLCLPT